jgi:zinc protease
LRRPAEWKNPTLAGQQWQLPNGLNVVAEQDSKAPTVSMALVMGTGAADDPPGKEGLAHLVEHLVFESRPEGRRTLSGILDLEADVQYHNAITEQDLTTFLADAPRDSLPVLVDVARDLVSWPLANVDPEQVPVVLSTVRAELDEASEPGPSEQIAAWSLEAIYPPSHPYGRSVGGTRESLAALSFEDAVGFARAHYRPNNATLVFTGGVDAQQLGRLLSTAFRGTNLTVRALPVRTGPPDPPPDPPALQLTRHRAHIENPQLRILWSLPSDYGAGGGNMLMLLAYLNVQLERIRWEDSNIASASIDSDSGVRATTVAVVANLRDGAKAEATAQFLIDRLVGIAERGSEGAAVFRAPPRWVGASTILAMENPRRRAMALAKHGQVEGEPFGYVTRFSELTHPDSTLVQRWLRLLTRQRARVLYVEPVEGWGASGGWLPPLNPPPDRVRPEELPPLSGVDLLGHLPDLVGAKSRVLTNGLAVEVVPIRGAPTATAVLAFPGGTAVGPTGAAEMLESWGLDPSADRVPAFYDGAMFSDSYAKDRLWVQLHGQPQNIHRMIDWLGDWVRERRVPDKSWVAAFDRVGLPVLRRWEARDEVRVFARHTRALYPGSPWGQEATSDQLGDLGSSDLRQWAKRIIAPSGAVLVVTGDFDAAGTLARVERAFGEWGGESRPAPPSPESPAPHAPTLFVSPRDGAHVAQVLFSCRLPPAKTSRQVLVSTLAASTLREALYRSWRLESGRVYSVGAAARVYWGGAAHFSLAVTVPNERLAEILAGLHTALGERRLGVVEESDFEHAKQTWVRKRDLAFLTSPGAAEEIATLRLSGGSLSELVSQGVIAADVSLDEIDQTLRTCPETAVLSVTGDAAQARAALSSSSWGRLEGAQ